MKRIIVFLLVVSLYNCEFKKEESSTELGFAKELANKILITQKEGSFYKLSNEEADPKMITGLNASVQKQSYTQIKSLFGDYKGLNFESLVHVSRSQKYSIYRFKGDFKSNTEVEIRVVLNEKGKLGGFFVKPWSDKL